MVLIKDLGVIKPTPKSKYKKRYGEYQCKCGNTLITAMSAVKSGRITQCVKCGTIKPLLCKVNLIKQFNEKHNCKYDYSKFIFYGYSNYSVFICPVHGEFTQQVKLHLSSNGCQACGQELRSIKLRKSNITRPAYLYYVYFKEYDLYKIGVSTRIKERFNGEIHKPNIIQIKEYQTEAQAYYVENQIKIMFNDYLYKGVAVLKRKGNTELFTKPIDFKTSVETIESTDEYKSLEVSRVDPK